MMHIKTFCKSRHSVVSDDTTNDSKCTILTSQVKVTDFPSQILLIEMTAQDYRGDSGEERTAHSAHQMTVTA